MAPIMENAVLGLFGAGAMVGVLVDIDVFYRICFEGLILTAYEGAGQYACAVDDLSAVRQSRLFKERYTLTLC